MCQLTFTNLGDAELNKTYLIVQSFINTLTDHKDGFGCFTEGEILKKTNIAPSNCTNLGSFVGKFNESPVLSHVRKATFTGGKKLVDASKSHPFETEHFIFAHNGTLDLRLSSKRTLSEFGDKIDSEIFLQILEEKYTENKDLVRALNDAYLEFNGKFAFLIYEKPLKKYYIIRGETAKLHRKNFLRDGKVIGFVVNTDKDSLEDGYLLFLNLMLAKGIKFDWNDTTEELKQNTIYSLSRTTNDLIIEGGLIETKKFVPAPVVDATPAFGTAKLKGKKIDFKDEMVQNIFELCVDWNISIRYLDEIVFHTLGKPILACDEADITYFMGTIVPELKRWQTAKNIIKEWEKINPLLSIGDVNKHINYLIEFPYILETDITALRNLRKEKSKDDQIIM